MRKTAVSILVFLSAPLLALADFTVAQDFVSQRQIEASHRNGGSESVAWNITVPEGQKATVTVSGEMTTVSCDSRSGYVCFSGDAEKHHFGDPSTYTATFAESGTVTFYVSASPGQYTELVPIVNPITGAITLSHRYKTYSAYSCRLKYSVTVKYSRNVVCKSLVIEGDSSVVSGERLTLKCKAGYADGSSKYVKPTWTISEGSSYASISSSGVLTAASVSASRSVTVKATYDDGTRKWSVAKSITVRPLPPVPRELKTVAYGYFPFTFRAGDSGTLNAYVNYSDGSTADDVMARWEIISGSDYMRLCVYEAGVSLLPKCAAVKGVGTYCRLQVSMITSVQTAVVRVSYEEGGVTLSTDLEFTLYPVEMLTIAYHPGAYGTGTNRQFRYKMGGNSQFSILGETYTRAGYRQTGWAESDGGEMLFSLRWFVFSEMALLGRGKTGMIDLYPCWSPRDLKAVDIVGPDGVRPGYPTNYTCVASYSDGSSNRVSATWSISSGSDVARVASDGRVIPGSFVSEQTAVLRADYSELDIAKSVTREIRILPDPAKMTVSVKAAVRDGCAGFGTVAGGNASFRPGAKASLKAKAAAGYVFSGWENAEGVIVSQNPAFAPVVGLQDETFVANFIPADEDWVSLSVPAEVTNVTKSAMKPIVISAKGGSLTTVKVTGLSFGPKFTDKALDVKGTKTVAAAHYEANTIYGTPAKSGIYLVSVTAKTAGNKSVTKTIRFIVRASGENLLDVVWDTGRGKVTGLGAFPSCKALTLKATAIKPYVFAGWYLDATFRNPAVGEVDYRTPSFPVATESADKTLYARFVAAEEDGVVRTELPYGFALDGPWSQKLEIESFSLPSVTAKNLPPGLKFDAKRMTIAGTPTKPGTYTVTLSLKNATVKRALTQTFVMDVANIESAHLVGVDYGKSAYVYRGGVSADWDLGRCARDGYAVTKVSGLPSGLKFNVKTGKVEGVPTKAGTFTATITLKNGKSSSVATVTMTVEPIDAWVIGSFNGGSDEGTVQLSVGNAGKLSGKLMEDAMTYSLSAPAFTAYDETSASYSANVTASWSFMQNGKAVKTNETWTVLVKKGTTGGLMTSDRFEAWQDNWKSEPWKTVGKSLAGEKATYAVLTDGEISLDDADVARSLGEPIVGKVTLSFSKDGKVQSAGEFVTGHDGNGKLRIVRTTGLAVVCATASDPFDGLVFVRFAPNASKGFGGYFQCVPVSARSAEDGTLVLFACD